MCDVWAAGNGRDVWVDQKLGITRKWKGDWRTKYLMNTYYMMREEDTVHQGLAIGHC